MTLNASRRARPDLVAIMPNNMAPKRNHGVVLEKPAKATGNGHDAERPREIDADQAGDRRLEDVRHPAEQDERHQRERVLRVWLDSPWTKPDDERHHDDADRRRRTCRALAVRFGLVRRRRLSRALRASERSPCGTSRIHGGVSWAARNTGVSVEVGVIANRTNSVLLFVLAVVAAAITVGGAPATQPAAAPTGD